MGVDYVANITEARIDLNGVFNDNVDATTSKPFFLEFMAKEFQKVMQLKRYVTNWDIRWIKSLLLVIV